MKNSGITPQMTTTRNRPRTDFMDTKRPLRFGFWNVRTMWQLTKTEQVLQEVAAYNLDIVALSEVRWIGFGKETLDNGRTIIYSGAEKKREAGVAMLISRKAAKSLISWTPVNERVMFARFQGHHIKVTVVACYAPTNDADEEVKERFYDTLNSVSKDIPRHDMVIFAGDFNAKVGDDRSYCPEVLGPHGLGDRNENGALLIDFASTNDLLIGGTQFRHKNIHKYTWTSPDGATRNQIDHFLINRKWRSSLQDVRTLRGADAGSDHCLCIAKIVLKLKTPKKKTDPSMPLYDSDKLAEPEVRRKFFLSLHNRFEALSHLGEGEGDVDAIWSSISNTFNDVAKEVIGHKKRHKDRWISDKTWNLIHERKTLKQHLVSAGFQNDAVLKLQAYRDKDKLVKKSARSDKRTFLESKAAEAEEAAKKGDSKTVYRITNEMIGKRRKTDGPVKDKNGRIVTEEKEIEEVWANHFESVLNRPEPINPPNIPETPLLILEINTDPPTETEIVSASKKLKNGRAPGNDRISAEMLKTSVRSCVKTWILLFSAVWAAEVVPKEWMRSTLVKLFKKGDVMLCDNWRGISLLSIPGKLLALIILHRIQPMIDKHLRDEQHGFRPNRSCADLIFALRMMLEETNEWRQKLYLIFIDFEKAFDSVHRDTLWKILKYYGVPDKLVKLIMALYENTECCVQMSGCQSRYFRIISGVKQGCVLSPFLFVLVIDYILRGYTDYGIPISNEKRIADIDFADDISLLESDKQKLQQFLDAVRENALRFGLKINASKTKSMAVTGSPLNIKCGNEDVEQVVQFKYLGSTVENTGAIDKEIHTRIGQASGSFTRLKQVWRSQKFSNRLKLRVFNSNVLPVMLYGSECWKLNQQQEKRLQAFENNCLRRILNINWTQHVTNQTIRQITGQPLVIDKIRTRRWKYLGHVVRMKDDRTPKSILQWQPTGTRRRGRPKNTLRRTYQRDLLNANTSIQPHWEDVMAAAHLRDDWRLFVDALGASGGTGGSKV